MRITDITYVETGLYKPGFCHLKMEHPRESPEYLYYSTNLLRTQQNFYFVAFGVYNNIVPQRIALSRPFLFPHHQTSLPEDLRKACFFYDI